METSPDQLTYRGALGLGGPAQTTRTEQAQPFPPCTEQSLEAGFSQEGMTLGMAAPFSQARFWRQKQPAPGAGGPAW